MLAYLTEIISKKDWKEEYGQGVYNKIDKKFYRKSLNFLKTKIFTPANLSDRRYIFINTTGSKFTTNNIVKYKVDDNDRKLVSLINEHTKYKIPENKIGSFLTIGKCLLGKEITNINLAFAELELKFNMNNDEYIKQKTSRELTLKNKEIQYDGEKDPKKKEQLAKIIEGIKKRIQLEDEKASATSYETLEKLITTYKKGVDNLLKLGKYVITLTYDTRAVASQSTKVSWRSCMNLDDGEYRQFVPKSINIGTFIAYLATRHDKLTLDNPIGRVLCKAYYGYDDKGENPDVIWIAGQFYPGNSRNKMQWFGQGVQAFLNQNNKPKYRYYNQTTHNYHDSGEPNHIDLVKDFGVDENSVENNSMSRYKDKVKGIKQFKPTSFDDLSDIEQDQVRDIAYEIAIDDYDYETNLDDSERQEDFVRDAYEDELNDAISDWAHDEVNRDDYESDGEYHDAIDEKINDISSAQLRSIIKDVVDRHRASYRRYLYGIFNDDLISYVDISDYIDDAFDRYVDENY